MTGATAEWCEDADQQAAVPGTLTYLSNEIAAGSKVARAGWKPGEWLQMVEPRGTFGFDENGKPMVLSSMGPFMGHRRDGEFVMWQPPRSDLYAEDWEIRE